MRKVGPKLPSKLTTFMSFSQATAALTMSNDAPAIWKMSPGTTIKEI